MLLLLRKIYRWGLSRYCPLCKSWLRAFIEYLPAKRKDALCPICLSLERHRGHWYFLRKSTDLLNGEEKSLLHVAPEESLVESFSSIENVDYLSIDLNSPLAMRHMDLTDMPLGDDTFDVIYCSHVLEHIVEDGKAIAELYRVMKPGGWGIIQIPVSGDETIEDFSVTDPEELLKLYGHREHVRLCGKDYIRRLESGGFKVKVVNIKDITTPAERLRMGMEYDEEIFYCEKVAG